MLNLNHVSSLYGKRKRCKPVCLFGAPDPLEMEKLYEEAFMASRDNFSKRWNFDVYTDEPLSQPRGVQWTSVEGVDDTPVSTGEDRLTAAPEETTTTTSPEGRVRESYAEVNSTSSLVGSRTACPARYSPYNKQKTVKDFWCSKKAPSHAALKNRQTRKSEDATHTRSQSQIQRESSNVTI